MDIILDRIIIFSQLVFTFIISSMILFLLIARIGNLSKEKASRYFSYTIGLGPLTISWILATLLWLFPYHTTHFYKLIIYLLFTFAALFSYKKLSILSSALKEFFKGFPEIDNKPKRAVFFAVLLLIISMIALISLIPMTGSDQIDYLNLSEILAQEKSVALYPLLDPNQTGGMITSWTHPLGFVSLYVWTNFISNSAGSSLWFSMVTPTYVLYTLMLFWQIFPTKQRMPALLSMLLLLTMPLYFIEGATNHIDSMRMYSFFLLFVYLAELLPRAESSWQYVLLGYIMGMCLFSHSLGLLAVPMFSVIFLTFSDGKLLNKIVWLSLICFIGFLFVTPRYMVNYKTFHSIIEDNSPVWKISSLNYDYTLNVIRGIYLPTQQWFFGFFKGFTKVKLFGFSYWVLILSLFIMPRNLRMPSWPKVKKSLDDPIFSIVLISFLVLLLFYGMVFLSLLLGINAFIKNDRYMMTIQPFVAILGAVVITKFLHKYAKEEVFNEA